MSEYGIGCMTYAEAYAHLNEIEQILHRHKPPLDDRLFTALGMAAISTEKQIPKKPANILIFEVDGVFRRSGNCPHCGNSVFEHREYCDCGQRLEWDIRE